MNFELTSYGSSSERLRTTLNDRCKAGPLNTDLHSAHSTPLASEENSTREASDVINTELSFTNNYTQYQSRMRLENPLAISASANWCQPPSNIHIDAERRIELRDTAKTLEKNLSKWSFMTDTLGLHLWPFDSDVLYQLSPRAAV